jgi:hypothetical protein
MGGWRVARNREKVKECTLSKEKYDMIMQLGCHPVAVHIYTQTIHGTTQITAEQHK